MSNMQNNYYGIPWQQSSQQVNYGQYPPPYLSQQPMPFSAPPPPPPPENQPNQPPEPGHQNVRKPNNQNNSNKNFNNQQHQGGGYNNDNRGQQQQQPQNPNNRQQQQLNSNNRQQQQQNFNNRQQQQQNPNKQQQNFNNRQQQPQNFNNQQQNSNNQQNFNNQRGKRGGGNRGGGNQRGNNRFNNAGDNMQNTNNMGGNNFNDSMQNNNQMNNNFGNPRGKNKNQNNNRGNNKNNNMNNNNRGGGGGGGSGWNNKNNNNKNNNNNAGNSRMNSGSNKSENNQKPPPPKPTKFAHDASQVVQQPTFQFSSNACSSASNLEEEFLKWEEQFKKWLNEMKDHPDKQQYQKYKDQFMQYRETLMARIHKLKEKSISNPPMSDEQIKFSCEWSAGDPNKTNPADVPSTSKTLYDPKTVSTQLPPPSFTTNSDLPVSSILFGRSTNLSESSQTFMNDEDDNYESFEHVAVVDNSAIPGLSFFEHPPEPAKESHEGIEDDVVILDDSQTVAMKANEEKNLPPPPIPIFVRTKSRNKTNICTLLDEPARSNRPDKILIVIRGAPGSGKHYLADMILREEVEKGNDRCRILSIRDFVDNYDNNRADEYDNDQFNQFKDMIQEGYINFAIIVLNGCGIKHFNRITHMAYGTGYFECYSIEIHQKNEICQKYCHGRTFDEIRNANEDLTRFSTPLRIKLLDPSPLYYPKEMRESMQEKPPQPAFDKHVLPPTINIPQQSSNNAPTEDFAKKMAQILQNENVLQLLQAHMNNTPIPQPLSVPNQSLPPQNRPVQQQRQMNQNMHQLPPVQPIQPKLEECPIFKPSKVIDYDHKHKQTFEESLMEFRVFRSIDYNHKTSRMLYSFIFDMDIDKIIEKRKAIALRRKILEYLRSAERPEDTVSNPKYPGNWEALEKQERPPRKSKRRKRKTAKIQRILRTKAREASNNWMTEGYVPDQEKEQKKMDLEAISSDDDEMHQMEEKPAKKIKLDSPKVPVYHDEYADVFKTIPDFNHFQHPNVINVKNILYTPDRRTRPHKILIILRGPPGAGKSHLTQLIKRKESDMGNASNVRILSIDDYYVTEDDDIIMRDDKTVRKYLENIQKHLKKTICDNLHNFIIIDAENCDFHSYIQFHQIGSSMGFAVYTIELYQTVDICLKQTKRSSSRYDIAKSIELLEMNRIPREHNLLIPTALYDEYKCLVNPILSVGEKPQVEPKTEEVKIDDSIKNYQNYLVQTIDDDYLAQMPQFNWHNRDVMDIREILEEPGRSKITKNIAILMRGPGGSGKSELAAKILNKEKQRGNEHAIFLSVEDFFINEMTKRYEFNARDIDSVIQKLIRKLLELMRSKSYNFIMLDIETGDFAHYMQIYELLSKQNMCYTIETYQDATICAENDVHKRPIKEIEAVLEEMNLNPTPENHILLDCSMFYKHQPHLSEKPKKSALKISPNTSVVVENVQDNQNELEKIYETSTENATWQEMFQAIFNQRINVGGKFVERNSSPPSNLPEFNWFNVNIGDIRELLEEPGRQKRPEKIAIFIRGAPASGKSYVARLIQRKEIEHESEEIFHLGIDEYFETIKYRETEFDGQYEKYIESHADCTQIESYMEKLKENFKDILTNGEKTFIVIDGDFCDLKHYMDMREEAISHGFTCYTIELNQDDNTCLKYNDHKWPESFILERNKKMQEIQTPDGHNLLDPEYLYHEYNYDFNPDGDIFEDQSNGITNENEDDFVEDDELSFGRFKMSAQTSKWDDDEAPDMERLDGIKTKASNRVTMADYLQTDDDEEWSMRPSQSGKKRVRWADIEEKKAQEHMRKIGFIVGHTDWNRMTDESDGKSALEKTKFIEPRHKK